ncbi:MAG: anhydro-N-acetylmuramic acid kinase [Flavobacteriales bacterium]|nr:anhydro-N-acetylmuramic acid kinase [Flavobacteriales bacterium]|tara:strand:+ start:8481 stop:9527 length:1047 start_codon:yes stop_codon:yes gene_type:complete
MNKKYHIIGIMSGTSLDGVDIVKCTFVNNGDWSFNLNRFETIHYSKYWKEKLEKLHTKSSKEIGNCDKEYGKLLGNICNQFIQKNNLKVDYISSHGHTIFHQPEMKHTLQIGCGNTIAETTNITTINNFRELDVSLGGQGAPLVPIGDLHLFSEYKYCLNLGGFANISEKKEKIIAFDICPVNIVMNEICKKINKLFDRDGKLANKGKVIPSLLNELNQLEFYKRNSPKSLGREWVEKNINPIINKNNYSTIDKLSTFCEHIGYQIGSFLKDESVLVSGGGTYNKYLIEKIREYSKSKIIIPKSEIIDFKEAIIFAFLGVLRLENKNNCLMSVTGAKTDNCGGDIYIK